MKIGWATDADGPRIRALLLQDGLDLEGGQWVGLGRTWLVARDEAGTVQACIALHPGRPIGRADFLSVEWGIKGLSRVRIVKSMIEASMAILGAQGSSFATGLVSYTMPDFGDVLSTYGGKQLNEGWMYIAALNEVLGKIEHGRRTKIDDEHAGRADS